MLSARSGRGRIHNPVWRGRIRAIRAPWQFRIHGTVTRDCLGSRDTGSAAQSTVLVVMTLMSWQSPCEWRTRGAGAQLECEPSRARRASRAGHPRRTDSRQPVKGKAASLKSKAVSTRPAWPGTSSSIRVSAFPGRRSGVGLAGLARIRGFSSAALVSNTHARARSLRGCARSDGVDMGASRVSRARACGARRQRAWRRRAARPGRRGRSRLHATNQRAAQRAARISVGLR